MALSENIEQVEFKDNGIIIDAEVIAEELGLEPSVVPQHIHEGKITTICEQGIDHDAGLFRLTFFYLSRRFRLIVGPDGKIRSRSLLDFGDRPLPALAHRLK